ncbi:hypothetical protein Y032_0100g3284 [Ancylostoma ceylanicum]|uniref:Uncharacterized protein n=1 Tax=Ancylostoma ceylanicum TaxID=53326 RepID=A0A016TI75_9BILA|nr:hypothetical protein Y032_0100g3284 [Ancylostoma ceylanicum]
MNSADHFLRFNGIFRVMIISKRVDQCSFTDTWKAATDIITGRGSQEEYSPLSPQTRIFTRLIWTHAV